MVSVSNGCRVRVAASVSGHPLRCNTSWNGTENEFLLTDLGDNFSVYSIAEGNYVSANLSVTGIPLQACAGTVGSGGDVLSQPGYGYANDNPGNVFDDIVSANFSVTGIPLQVRASGVGTSELFYLNDVAS
jgi:hypothetical protein